MKPIRELIFLSQSISFNKPLSKVCQRLKGFYSACASSLLEQLLPGAPIQLRNSSWSGALQIFRAGLAVCLTLLENVRVSLSEAWSNKRFRVGVLVGLVALPAWKCYLFFDINARYDWYYVNWVFYLNTIRPYLCGIFISVGFFLCSPQKWMFRWLALPVALFCATEILQQSLYKSWEDFYQAMPSWQIVLLLLSAIYPVFVSINYLLYRKYHLKDGTTARINGILRMPSVPIKQKYDLLEQMIKEQEQFNSRI